MESFAEDFLSKCVIKPSNSNQPPPLPARNISLDISQGFEHLMYMFEMKQYDELNTVIDLILSDHNHPLHKENYFEISIKLLRAEVRSRSGLLEEAFTEMNDMKSTYEYNNSYVWKWRIDCTIINAAIRLHLYDVAIEVLQEIHGNLQEKLNKYKESHDIHKNILNAHVIVLCRLGRLLLQTGSMEYCIYYSTILSDILSTHNERLDQGTLNHIKNFEGLILFSSNEFENAIIKFQEIMASHLLARHGRLSKPESVIFSLDPKDIDVYTCLCELDEAVFPAAANNYAVCAMHLGQVKTAVSLLESIIQQDPIAHMTDPIVFNLCTMYDISFAANVSDMKKRALKSVADVYCVGESTLSLKSFRPPVN